MSDSDGLRKSFHGTRKVYWIALGIVTLATRLLSSSRSPASLVRSAGRAEVAAVREAAEDDRGRNDAAPGDYPRDEDQVEAIGSYVIGLGLAALLTAGSFYLSTTKLVWGPSVSVALIVFAIAQMGVHLVFFLHITTGADNTNNVMALAFGVLIVFLLIGGSLWITTHLNYNMLPMEQIMLMRQ